MKKVIALFSLLFVFGGVVSAQGIEGDVTPRDNPDNVVLSTDVIQIRRFAVGLDAVNSMTNEGQRADCAPSSSLGDGVITAGDVIQTRRYATGLDASVPAGGPIVTAFLSENTNSFFRIGKVMTDTGKHIAVPVELLTVGSVSGFGFTLEYDDRELTATHVLLGRDVAMDSLLTVNLTATGKVGVLVDSINTLSFSQSKRAKQVVWVIFEGRTFNTSSLKFSNDLAEISVVDINGNPFRTEFISQK